MKLRSKFSHSFTNRGCLHCTVLKSLYGFKEKRAHKAKDMPIFHQNIQNEVFKIFRTFKNNMKFTRVACWINSKISSKDKNTILMKFLFCHYCWSLLWCYYWRSLMLWNSTSWSRLKLPVQIRLAFHPCDPFLINNCNMSGNSFEK